MRKRRRCFLLVAAVLSCCVTVYFPILLSIRPEEMETWNITRDMAILVRPHNVTSIISAETFCIPQQKQPQKSDVFLLVVVCSSVQHFKARQSIRETWGSSEALNREPRTFANKTDNFTLGSDNRWFKESHTVRLVFMLGRSEDENEQEQIVQENTKYNDIVQEDFHDTYNNLTLKSVMMLKWVNSSCPNAKYIMKTDDDTFVNLPRLVMYLLKHGRDGLLMGALICGAVPVKNKHSKWYAPRVLYSERFYPNYLSGTGYVFSNSLVAPLYQTALDTPFFHLEDVYITGICAKQLHIRPIDHQGFTYQKRANDPCLFHFGVTGHRMSPVDMRNMWKSMWKKELNCDSKKIKLRDFRPGKCF
ncbi:hypothetical protein CHUAL_007698 [Chamberlinius hualienensis]